MPKTQSGEMSRMCISPPENHTGEPRAVHECQALMESKRNKTRKRLDRKTKRNGSNNKTKHHQHETKRKRSPTKTINKNDKIIKRFGETSRMNISRPVQHIGGPKSPRMPRNSIRGNVPDEHFEARTPHWGPGETSRMKTSRPTQHIGDPRSPRMPGNLIRGHVPDEHFETCTTHWGAPETQECPGNSIRGNVPDEHFKARAAHRGPQKPTNAREIRFGETSRMNTSKPAQHIGDSRSPRMPGKLDSLRGPHSTLGTREAQECPGNSIRGNVPDDHFEARTSHWGTPETQECPGNSIRRNVPDEHFEACAAHWGPQKPKNARETEWIRTRGFLFK
jgi:hypothetical protein